MQNLRKNFTLSFKLSLDPEDFSLLKYDYNVNNFTTSVPSKAALTTSYLILLSQEPWKLGLSDWY